VAKDLAIDVRGVSKQFCQGSNCIQVLKDVDFQAYLGELLMVVGPSGCGKTTLLSVVAGTLFFDQGEIDLLNQPLHQLKESVITNFRRQHIGFIFQQYHLIKTLNCLDNVMIPLLLNKVSLTEAKERAALMLEKVGLKGKEKQHPKQLSGGQQQRVSIARALVHQPRLVICDEPTAALDAETGAQIMDMMREIARLPNRCVIIVTHDNRIFKYADRITEMNDGRVLKG
jgi:putative ABC transport system ATP-binding protein